MIRLDAPLFARTTRLTVRAAAKGMRNCREAFEVSSVAYLLRQAVAGVGPGAPAGLGLTAALVRPPDLQPEGLPAMIQSLHEQPRGFVVRPIHASDLERKAERFRQILADIDFALTIEIEKLERR